MHLQISQEYDFLVLNENIIINKVATIDPIIVTKLLYLNLAAK